MVSVIIPCYNSFHLMGKCLEALESQTVKEFEVIIVDDCSKDDSYNKLLNYKKNSNLKISVLKTKKNSGPGEARNVGIRHSTGKIITFCDSDDWYEVNFIEEMKKKIDEYEADIVMCNYNQVFENKKILKMNYTKKFNEKSTIAEYLANSHDSLCLLAIKREIIEKVKIPKLFNGEDMASIPIIISNCKKISYTDKYLYNYYIRNDSSSNNINKDVFNSMIYVFELIKNRINKTYNDEIEFIGIKTILYAATLTGFKSKIENKQIIYEVNKFIRQYPNYYKNKYNKSLDIKKRIYIFFIKNKLYVLNRLYCKIHSKIING